MPSPIRAALTLSARLLERRAPITLLAAALLVASPAGAGEPGDGFADDAWWAARQRDYLEYATAIDLIPSSPLHVINYMERARIDETFTTTPGAVPADAWASRFDKLWRLRDTSDFDLVYMLNARYGYPDDPMIDPGLWDALDHALLNFKYWYTDPTPTRIVDEEQVIDEMWYWTENHVLLFHTNELLAGNLHPDTVFAVSGMTGAEHAARAREGILQWLEERAKFGFTEWHSNVYYNLDTIPLLTLIEFSGDPEIVAGAKKVLDLVLLDIALHTHRGVFGATHGRSYAKDKATALTEDTYHTSKLFFEDTDQPYQSRAASGGSLFARSQSYRLPEVIRRIARSDDVLIDRQRMNLPVDETPPADPTDPIPPAPFGLDFTDEARLPLWWSMGLLTTWVGMPLTFTVADRHELWETSAFQPFVALRDVVYDQTDVFEERLVAANELLAVLHPLAGIAVLKEVDTYTYRTPDYMLSTAQDYRKGFRASQIHTWQATLSEKAVIFTNHPGLIPLPEDNTEVPETWNWQNSDEPGPGYWTGEASIPRSAQHENVGIHIYQPAYIGSIPGFEYRNETHAYFPHAHLSEVVQQGPWTFGRSGDAYVALYSFRPTEWREGQPELWDNRGEPFDLVAPGSARNVWVVECGSLSESGSFEAFRQAISQAALQVTDLGQGFDVAYTSPSLGLVEFGWEGPLRVAGQEVPIRGYERHDNRYVQTPFGDTRYEISDGSYSLLLDFEQELRVASVPAPGAAALQLAAFAVAGALARRSRAG